MMGLVLPNRPSQRPSRRRCGRTGFKTAEQLDVDPPKAAAPRSRADPIPKHLVIGLFGATSTPAAGGLNPASDAIITVLLDIMSLIGTMWTRRCVDAGKLGPARE
jgi:hypothetical protein